MLPGSTGHSLPIGLKIGAGTSQDYLVLDFIMRREERESIREGYVLDWLDSPALYPTHHRCLSLVRLLRPSEVGESTLFAVKSSNINGRERAWNGVTVDFNYLRHDIHVLKLIWNGTRMRRQRSTKFYQDFLDPHRGKQHVVELFDTFVNVPVPTREDPRHCSVLELLGPSLSEIRLGIAPQQLHPGFAKEATKQVLLALDFLHTQCGILHLCVNTSTVLIKFATEQETLDFYLYKDFDALDLSSIHVKLTGFDCAELIDNGPPHDFYWGPLRQEWITRLTTAPEIDPVEAHFNFRYLCQLDPEGLFADSWSMGFFVWELLTGEVDIFRADSPPTWPSSLWHSGIKDRLVEYGTRCCLNFLKFVSERSYPPRPIDHPTQRRGWNRFPENHKILFNFPDALRTDQGWSMRERLVAHDVLTDGDVDQVVAVLRGCFQADPSRRLTARQLLETEWMREETKASK